MNKRLGQTWFCDNCKTELFSKHKDCPQCGHVLSDPPEFQDDRPGTLWSMHFWLATLPRKYLKGIRKFHLLEHIKE